MHESLFVGRDLALDCYDGGHPISIVTFEDRDKEIHATTPSPFGEGFGKGVFSAIGFNEYLVKKSRNHWYQTREMLDVVRLINNRTQNTRVITYGISMGGFAAINFAPWLNSDRYISISGLYDVEPGNDAGDIRWAADTTVIDFPYNLIKTGACRSTVGYAFYCTNGPDERHAKLMESETQATLVPVEYGGHPCSYYLNDTYKLKLIVEEIARDTFDTSRFYRVMNERTPQTYYPYERLAAALTKEGAIDEAIANVEVALSFKPDNPRLCGRLADLLLKKGDIERAETWFNTAIALAPTEPHYHVRMSHVVAARRNFDEAVRQMEIAIALFPKRPEYHVRLGEWLIRADRLQDATSAFKAAIVLAPESAHARSRLAAVELRIERKAASKPAAAT